jgi:hypothetical protein
VRTCEAGCGSEIVGRASKRYCSEVCSKRTRRRKPASLPPDVHVAKTTARGHDGETTRQVRARLATANRLDTWEGAAALAAARQIDAALSPVGLAPLLKELRATMEAALAGAVAAADPVDEVRARRDRKYAS